MREQNGSTPIAVRFITIGSQDKAASFCAPYGVEALCLGDPGKATYAAMGFAQFNLLKLFSTPALSERRKENKAAGFSQNWGATNIADGAQLPGAAIVDADGILRWIHRATHPGDLPTMREMFTHAG